MREVQEKLKQLLIDLENVHGDYLQKKSMCEQTAENLRIRGEQLAMREMNFREREERVFHIESLEALEKQANDTIKAAEHQMQEMYKARTIFDVYKDQEKQKIDKHYADIAEKRNVLEHDRIIVQKEIADFNEWKKKYPEYTFGLGGLL